MKKNAVITGTNRGIGYEILKTFAHAGYNVWACARVRDVEFESRISKIADDTGTTIQPVYFDLSSEKQIQEGMKSIMPGYPLAVHLQ